MQQALKKFEDQRGAGAFHYIDSLSAIELSGTELLNSVKAPLAEVEAVSRSDENFEAFLQENEIPTVTIGIDPIVQHFRATDLFRFLEGNFELILEAKKHQFK